MRRKFVAGALAAVVLAAAVWWGSSRPTIRREPGLNVLLITIDTLRADAVGVYGRPGAPTPWIDRLANGGVRFTTAYAHNVVTLPSHANMLLGQLPPRHGVRDNAGFRVPADSETLATLLKGRGYRTGAFVSAFPLDARFGLARGFDVYEDKFLDTGPRPAFLIQERRADRTIALARQWLDAAGDEPWFCWVHLYEPHYPYEPPEPFLSRWPGDPYMGEVAAADAALASLVGPILSSGEESRTLVIVTSDHGESLGEHGEATHGIFAYEPVIRVPLIVHQPRLFRPRVLDTPVGHVDLLPTVLDALGMSSPDSVAGRSVLPSMAGLDERDDPSVYFEALSGSLNRGWAPLVGVIRHGFKFIDLPIPELYDLRADPREERNLAEAESARVAAMRADLERFMTSAPAGQSRSESGETRDRLRSLGYVSGPGTEPSGGYTEDDDPKKLIGLDTMLQDILARYLDGDMTGALGISRDLVQRRPGMALSWMYLAHLEREAGNLGAAVEAMRRALALSPGDPVTLAQLGAYLTEAGRASEAAELLKAPALESHADVDILTTRALALARIGQSGEAVATLERARTHEPSDARLLVHLGTVHLTAGNRPAARQAFQQALQFSPQLARAHSSLGVLALEDGDAGRAAEHWRAAVTLDPREHDTILALGVALARQGRTAGARACFEFFAASAPPARYARDLDRVRAWLNGAR